MPHHAANFKKYDKQFTMEKQEKSQKALHLHTNWQKETKMVKNTKITRFKRLRKFWWRNMKSPGIIKLVVARETN